jgi:hypothetical protein
MHRFCALLFAFFIFIGYADAQAAGVKKFPGEPVVMTWTYLVSDEANITGYRFYWSLLPTAGPYNLTTITAIPSARTVTIPASFPQGSVVYYFTARGYFTGTVAPIATVESVDSNSAEVDRNVVTPAGLLAK